MSKKHFIAIAAGWADIIKNCRDEDILVWLKIAVANQADYFQTVNPNFDRDRFLVACGV